MFDGSESISWEELQASLENINRERTRSIAERIYITCDDPSSSKVAVYLAAFIMLLIITSCVSFMLETVEVSQSVSQPASQPASQ